MSNSTSRTESENGDHAKGVALEAGADATGEHQPMRVRFQETLAGFQARAKDAAKAIRRQAVQADKRIRAKPYHAMGIAAGVGIIAGYIISRRRSSS